MSRIVELQAALNAAWRFTNGLNRTSLPHAIASLKLFYLKSADGHMSALGFVTYLSPLAAIGPGDGACRGERLKLSSDLCFPNS